MPFVDYKKYFKDKKITVHGLGLLGRGLGDVIFLANCGASLIVTDLKTKEQLEPSLKTIRKKVGEANYKKIKFVLGEHCLRDFSAQGGSASGRKPDFILKAAGIPLDSPFIAEAKKNKIPIKMDASWFAELAEGVQIVGVTGTRGKSTTTHLIYEITKASGRRVFLGGNVRGVATLPFLSKVKKGDLVVMELDSWQLQGFADSQISPNISVFTNLMVDHQNYYGSAALSARADPMGLYFADKAGIFEWQKPEDFLVTSRDVLGLAKKNNKKITGQVVVSDSKVLPKNWKIKLLGEHNKLNIAYAVSVARILNIPEKIIKKTVENFSGVPGRLEFVREIRGVKFYNDTTATTPDGVIAAVKALGPSTKLRAIKQNICLIGGGRDKELDYKKYVPIIKKSVKSLALFQGTGSDKILSALGKTKFPVKVFDNMKEAFTWTVAQSKKGDVVLLSPGAASFGVFLNEYDRGEKFNKLVKAQK